MREYAHATTTYAISDLLGIPEADRPVLLEAIGAPPSQLDGDAEMKVGTDPLIGMKPLFELVLRHVKPPVVEEGPFRLLGTILEANPYLGRIITGRITSGSIKPNQQVKVLAADGSFDFFFVLLSARSE